MWELRYVRTGATGLVIDSYPITDIFKDFRIEKTVGDELWIKTGDITLNSRSPFPFVDAPGVWYNWIVAYYKGKIVDAFHMPRDYDEHDEKFDNYKSRLPSIQKLLFDDCDATVINYNATFSEGWAFGMGAAGRTIGKIKITDENKVVQSYVNRWGFYLPGLLENMAGSEAKGYQIRSVAFVPTTSFLTDAPILYRGQSFDIGTSTAEQALNNTFNLQPAYKTTYLELFKLASIVYNSFIYAKPVIYEGVGVTYLGLDITLVPKASASVASPKVAHWLRRVLDRERFKIDGVKIASSLVDAEGNESFRYTQGATVSGSIFSRDVEIGSPLAPTAGADNVLYLSAGDWYVPLSFFDILDGNDPIGGTGNARPYFASGAVEPYYAGMISSGDGYLGSIFLNGEDMLDQIQVGQDVMQITRLTMTRRRKFSVEGIKIA